MAQKNPVFLSSSHRRTNHVQAVGDNSPSGTNDSPVLRKATGRDDEPDYKQIVESSMQGVWIIDNDGRTTYINQRMADLLGYTVTEILGRVHTEFMWEQDRPGGDAQLELRRQGVGAVWNQRYRRKDRSVLWTVAACNALYDDGGRVVGAVGMFTEITDLTEAGIYEQRAPASDTSAVGYSAGYESHSNSALLAEIIEKAPCGIYVVDARLRVREANAEAQAMLETLRPAIGRALHEVLAELWGDGVAQACVGHFQRTLETGDRYESTHFDHLRVDIGESQVVEWQTHRVTMPDGEHGVACYFRNVTDYERTVKALRESEALYRAIGESIAYGVWVCAPDGRNTYMSESFLHMIGCTQEQAAGFGWTKALHPDDRASAVPAWKACVRTKSRWDREFRFLGADGRWHHVLARGMPVMDDRGEVVCWAGINLDIGMLKEREETLRVERKRLSLALHSGSMGVYEFDYSSRRLWWSDEMYAVFGVTPKNFAPGLRAMLAMVHPEDRETLRSGIADSIARQTAFVGDFRICPPEGGTRWIGSRASTEYDADGRPVRHFGIAMDITVARRTFDELVAKDQRIRLATETTGVGIWEWDVNANTIRWDAEMFRIYGMQPAPDGLIAYSDWAGAVLPEDLPENEAILRKTVRDGGQNLRAFRIRRRDDSAIRNIESVETVRKSADGRIEFVIGTNLDVTDRKRVESELLRLTDELSEENRRKENFLATLAHELRNPLAPIRNAVEVLKINEPPTKELRWARDVIDRQARSMAQLVDDLMDLSRINQQKISLRTEAVELAAVVESTIEACGPLVNELGHELAVTLPGQPVVVYGDPLRLAQVFTNLVNNAAKYTDPGGRIEISAEVDEREVIVSVSDTGIGIAADRIESVFTMFAQADGGSSRSRGGLGVGLSLVKRLAEMHGGTVEARSPGLGRGSVFAVRLPVLSQSTATAIAESPVKMARGSGWRILVVDDNRDQTDSLSRFFEAIGNEVQCAHDGAEAIAAATAYRPHIVLCDIDLPGMTGYDVCRLLRRGAWAQQMLIVAVTGYGQDHDKRKSAVAGFDLHFVKPLDAQATAQILTRAGAVKFDDV